MGEVLQCRRHLYRAEICQIQTISSESRAEASCISACEVPAIARRSALTVERRACHAGMR